MWPHFIQVRSDWSQPRRTESCATKWLNSLWLREITARSVQRKWGHTRWSRMRWDEIILDITTNDNFFTRPIYSAQNGWNWPTNLQCIVASTFQNGLEDRNYDLRVLNGNDLSTLFINLMRFGPVAIKFTRVEFLKRYGKNWHIPLIFTSVSGMINLSFFLR